MTLTVWLVLLSVSQAWKLPYRAVFEQRPGTHYFYSSEYPGSKFRCCDGRFNNSTCPDRAYIMSLDSCLNIIGKNLPGGLVVESQECYGVDSVLCFSCSIKESDNNEKCNQKPLAKGVLGMRCEENTIYSFHN